MVDALHAHGIEVVLDVVYNHTAEGDEHGPTLSFRGLDNAELLPPAARRPQRATRTAPAAATRSTCAIRACCSWCSMRCATGSSEMHVDGFRFDLAPVLGRARPRLRPRMRRFFTALRAGPGAGAREADRRAVGHRARRLPARPLPGRLARMERPLPRHACAASGCAGERTRGEFAQRAVRLVSDVFQRTAAPPTRIVNYVAVARRLHAAPTWSATPTSTTTPTARTTATATATTSAPTAASKARPTMPAMQRAARPRAARAAGHAAAGAGHADAAAPATRSATRQRGNNNAYCQDNATSWLDWSQRRRRR